MGTRTLRITPEVVLGLCKHHNQKIVTACTENALPDDAEIVGVTLVAVEGDGLIEMLLHSAEWEGDGGELPSPVVETFSLAFAIAGDNE